jgi:hypothetical protein
VISDSQRINRDILKILIALNGFDLILMGTAPRRKDAKIRKSED